jgi:hypothetical protein
MESIYIVKVKYDGETKYQTYVIKNATSPIDAIETVHSNIGGAGIDFEVKSCTATNYVDVFDAKEED